MIKIDELFYTEAEVAGVLGLNRITIWRWIKQGKLHAQSVGGVVFIPRKEVDSIRSKAGKGGSKKKASADVSRDN